MIPDAAHVGIFPTAIPVARSLKPKKETPNQIDIPFLFSLFDLPVRTDSSSSRR
ncbi:MAG: hypothetical protein P8183_04000 [Anaerolineae bacterium]